MIESELDRIDPDNTPRTLKSGMDVEVTRLKTRQFFRLLKVFTHGASTALLQSSLDFNATGEEFGQKLLMLVMFSIPDAEQETIDLVQSLVRPAGLHEGPPASLTDAQREGNAALWQRLGRELFNPDIDDLVDICETVIRQEAGDIQALGKRLTGLYRLAQKTGQDKPGSPDPAPSPEEMSAATSQAAMPSSSTPSPPTTDGPTSTSSASPSAASAR